jgi:transcriptional regulator with XRE-family HTH domain
LSDPHDWRARLGLAIDRSGKKRAYIAEAAGMAPTTLGNILRGSAQPSFEKVLRLAAVCGESVAWIAGEDDSLRFTSGERSKILDAAEIMLRAEGWTVRYENGLAILRPAR